MPDQSEQDTAWILYFMMTSQLTDSDTVTPTQRHSVHPGRWAKTTKLITASCCPPLVVSILGVLSHHKKPLLDSSKQCKTETVPGTMLAKM